MTTYLFMVGVLVPGEKIDEIRSYVLVAVAVDVMDEKSPWDLFLFCFFFRNEKTSYR